MDCAGRPLPAGGGMNYLPDHRIVTSHCPWCGAEHDGALGLGSGKPPIPGDLSICIVCASVLEFGPLLELRMIADSKWRDYPEAEEIRRARRVVLSLDRRAKTETEKQESEP